VLTGGDVVVREKFLWHVWHHVVVVSHSPLPRVFTSINFKTTEKKKENLKKEKKKKRHVVNEL